MNDRRELLKGLAVGSVWATPVVSSVVLPAHAFTTGCSGGCFSNVQRGESAMVEMAQKGEVYLSWYPEETDCTGRVLENIVFMMAEDHEEAIEIGGCWDTSPFTLEDCELSLFHAGC